MTVRGEKVMTFFDVLTLIGGLSLFLFGMNLMGDALEKRAGSGLKALLGKLTGSRLGGFLTGLGITAVIQSSSATTVMVVGFVNSGLMTLRQAIHVIMGANVGTTVTAWILSLTGIQSDNFFMKLLMPSSFTPIMALVGVAFYMMSKNGKKKDTGLILLGFATLMFGMNTMSGAVAGLKDMEGFRELLLVFTNPVLGVVAGAVLTAIIQSSSASVGILQAVSSTGQITFGAAIPIIMGQNIGTCVTALISSIGVSRNAKRVSVIHISFNLIGTALGLLALFGGEMFLNLPFLTEPIGAVGIAFCHTIFNVCTTLVLLPFSRQLERLANKVISTEDKPSDFAFLDPRLMWTPGVAVSECAVMTNRMGALALESMQLALAQFIQYDGSREEQILANEDKLDTYEDRLGGYLVQISQHGTSSADMRTVSRLLHAIGDFERIGDHALNLQESAKELHEKQLAFSPIAREEVDVLTSLLEDLLNSALRSFQSDDPQMARQVEPLEETMDLLTEEIRSRHIRRLQSGQCTIQLGFILNDLLNNAERVGDHCSNIAVSVIEEQEKQAASHAYLHSLKKNDEFSFQLQQNLSRYVLPAETAEDQPAE